MTPMLFILAESVFEKKHPVFGVSFGTLLLILLIVNQLKSSDKKDKK